MVLGVPEDIVDDGSVRRDIENDSLVLPEVVDREETVPSKGPGHGLEDKDKQGSAVTPACPTLPAFGGE